jgi:hypothetical protein
MNWQVFLLFHQWRVTAGIMVLEKEMRGHALQIPTEFDLLTC